MAVTRFDIEVFDLPKTSVADHVEAVLSEHPEYRKPKRLANGDFHVSVLPGSFFLPTRMTIELEERHAKTAIRVATESQSNIIGDVFGYYDRYIPRVSGEGP